MIFPGNIAETDEVLSFLGTRRCRIVFRRYFSKHLRNTPDFRNNKHQPTELLVLDYVAGENCSFRSLTGKRGFAPRISPDGKKIVYNRSFGVTDIFARRIDGGTEKKVAFGASPHWWEDLSTGKDYIVFRTEAGKFSWPQPGKTMLQQVDPHTCLPIGEPQVINDHGFGAGLSNDGKYLATGYKTLDVVNLQSGEHRQFLEGDQVCGVSHAPDSSGRFMQLRLPHDWFGIVDWDGRMNRKYYLPEGCTEWQTPCWSNHSDFAVAVAADFNDEFNIFIIHLEHRDYLRVTNGIGCIHPTLWLAPA